jgi:mannosyltransferase
MIMNHGNHACPYRNAIGIALIAIVFLAFALRVYRLDGQSFWQDEILNFGYADRELSRVLDPPMPPEYLPLYFYILHGWMVLAGRSDFAVRFLALSFSMLALASCFYLGRRCFNRRIAVLAVLIMALNPWHIWYAQDNTLYAVMVCLTTASMALLAEGLHSDRRLIWTGYVLVTGASLYIHYYCYLIPIVQWTLVALIWLKEHRPGLLRRWVIVQGGVGLVFLPLLPRISGGWNYPGWASPPNPLELPALLLGTFSFGTTMPQEWRTPFLVGFAVLFTVGLIALMRQLRGNQSAWLVLCYLLVPLLAQTLIALRWSHFLVRYLMIVTPAYLLILALGLDFLRRLWLPLAPVAALFIVLASAVSLYTYYFNPNFIRPDYRGVGRALTAWSHPDDAIVLNGPLWGGLARYYHGPLPIYDMSDVEEVEQKGLGPTLTEITEGRRGIWLLLEAQQPGPVEFWLNNNAYQAYRGWYSGITLYLFRTDPLGDPRVGAQPLGADFGPAMHLIGYRLAPDPVTTGDVLTVFLAWQPRAAVPENYKVALKLVGEDGQVYRQEVRAPLDGFAPTSTWGAGQLVADRQGLWVPAEAPLGSYRVEVQVVTAANGTPLPVTCTLHCASATDEGKPLPALSLGPVVVKAKSAKGAAGDGS